MSTDFDRPSDGHLDAETLAAWMDGGLDPRAAAMAESHVSSCDRCQEIVALISHAETVHGSQLPASAPWYRRFRAAWLVPLTAGVAAVGLWMIVPANRTSQPLPMTQPEATIARDEAPQAKAAPFVEPPAASELKRQQAPAPVDKKDFNQALPAEAGSHEPARGRDVDASKNKEEKLADQLGARVDRLEERAAIAQPAAPPPPAAAPAARTALAAPATANAQEAGRLSKDVSSEIASPNPRTRWRLIGGGNVEYSPDGGVTWGATPTGVTEQLTAGASPAANVCWLVGKNGIVLLTTDGRQWRRLAFPEAIDLTSVVATDARAAQVTAANGTSFRTTDGGLTWTRP